MMRSVFLSLIISVFMLSSCSEEKKMPENIIKRGEFIEILTDIQIFKSTDQFVRNKDTGFDLDASYDFIFEEHGITVDDFSRSLDFYASDPVEFEKIYDEVIIRITEKQVEYTKD